ncbi:MAG: class I SAM-dependent methyltransferase [Rhodospirillales bacterium]|nr:class I SAM-dependent methyltransferase [Rhodospirillales bacterium]
MDKNAKFWSRIADKYAAGPVPDENIYQKKLKVTHEYLKPDMKVLEFGCGTGSTALVHAHSVKHILAIDIAERMLEIARQKAKEQGIENVDFKQANMEDLDVEKESIDVIFGLSILHLLKNKDQVISKVYKTLKPGGIFVSSTTCIQDFFKFYKLLEWFGPLGRSLGFLPLVNVFGSKELREAIKAPGFTIEYDWQPKGKGKRQAVFIIARKPEAGD